MRRGRGQILYRHRPRQTFDHRGGFTAQVRYYGADDDFHGPKIDREYLIAEARRLVRRWRREGRAAPNATGGDRAPEFPPDDSPFAHRLYDVLVPGKVFSAVWPRVVRCADPGCGYVWDAPEPRPGGPDWPPPCPACQRLRGNRQLQFVLVHPCGEIRPFLPPRTCKNGHRRFRLVDHASRFRDFRWECLDCRFPLPLEAYCGNPQCSWTNKQMQPLLHTAASANVGHGLTIVNPPREDFAARMSQPGFIVGTLARWLDVADESTVDALVAGVEPTQHDPEIQEAIRKLDEMGAHKEADNLRRRFSAVDLDDVRKRITGALGFDPLDDRGRELAHHLSVYQRVRSSSRVDLDALRRSLTPRRESLYRRYPQALAAAGFDPDETFLAGEFPVTYLAVGYSRGGFTPADADLVAYKGRTAPGRPETTLLYANPTDTEALVFSLDRDRVGRWLVDNGLVAPSEIADSGGVPAWFATRLDPTDGQPPRGEDQPRPGDPDYAAHRLFGLLHTIAHQVLRALAVDSGYSETSLSEYLFPYDLAFAIHPNGGKEFTIGALRTVLEQNLHQVVERAVDTATCLYDPHCMLSNDGADHGCLFLPETACQLWNRNLSRHLLYGSPDDGSAERRIRGYWEPTG